MDNQSLQNELCRSIELANIWKMRAKAATQLALYFNSLYGPDGSFMHDEDVKKEIRMQADRMLSKIPKRKFLMVTK